MGAKTSAWIVESLARGESAWVEHRGDSMWPTLRTGDRLRIERIETPLGTGMVVVAAVGNRLVAHRIVRIMSDGRVLLRGDALSGSDPPRHRSALVGRVTEGSRRGLSFQVGAGSALRRRILRLGRAHALVRRLNRLSSSRSI